MLKYKWTLEKSIISVKKEKRKLLLKLESESPKLTLIIII